MYGSIVLTAVFFSIAPSFLFTRKLIFCVYRVLFTKYILKPFLDSLSIRKI